MPLMPGERVIFSMWALGSPCIWNLVSGAPAAGRGLRKIGGADLVGHLSIRVTRKRRPAVASRGADTALFEGLASRHPPAQRSAAAAALRTGARVEEQQSHCYRHN